MTCNTLGGLQIDGIVRGNCADHAAVSNRPTHALIYKITGETLYFMQNGIISLKEGSILYIPRGESYTFQKNSEGESTYCLINFSLPHPCMEKPKVISPQNAEHISYVFSRMQKYWLCSHHEGNGYELLSLFYHLLFCLAQPRNTAYYPTQKNARLQPAIDYLEKNLYSPRLKVSTLSALCGISDVAFRTLFAAQFGEPPKKYIIRCRMLQAKAILESGEYGSIGEVSSRVGYEDALYFSRHFKSFFGYPPSQIQNRGIEEVLS